MEILKGHYTSAKIFANQLEDECYKQIKQLVNHSAFTNAVAIMPDAHAGKGAVIGFTMKMTNKIIPNVIGVDIGCGLLMYPFISLKDKDLPKIDSIIKKNIPLGHDVHKKVVVNDFDFLIPQQTLKSFLKKYNKTFNFNYKPIKYDESWLRNKLKQINFSTDRFYNSIGSLGGGNHFIEIGKNENSYYLIIHSGSRQFGNKIATYWQQIAKKHCKEDIPALAYLTGDLAVEYLIDMIFAQYYASLNRQTIVEIIFKQIKETIPEEFIESVHNYIDMEDLIIRKGAIRSYEGEKIIIPLNMRDGILICEGKSNETWNYSAPHGSGRKLSRNKAKQLITMEDYRKSMEGIYSSCINIHTIDESPFAYKDSDYIINAITPTAKILFKVQPVLNIKAKE